MGTARCVRTPSLVARGRRMLARRQGRRTRDECRGRGARLHRPMAGRWDSVPNASIGRSHSSDERATSGERQRGRRDENRGTLRNDEGDLLLLHRQTTSRDSDCGSLPLSRSPAYLTAEKTMPFEWARANAVQPVRVVRRACDPCWYEQRAERSQVHTYMHAPRVVTQRAPQWVALVDWRRRGRAAPTGHGPLGAHFVHHLVLVQPRQRAVVPLVQPPVCVERDPPPRLLPRLLHAGSVAALARRVERELRSRLRARQQACERGVDAQPVRLV